MAFVNHYTILGIPDYSEFTIVKQAFRKMALKNHPDKTNNQTSEEFLEIRESYDCLLRSKALYDIMLN